MRISDRFFRQILDLVANDSLSLEIFESECKKMTTMISLELIRSKVRSMTNRESFLDFGVVQVPSKRRHGSIPELLFIFLFILLFNDCYEKSLFS